MIDLSNNNGTGHDFKTAYVKGGQRRLYLKTVEGTGFSDPTYARMRRSALAAGFHVGGYDFLHPLEASAQAAADFFLARLPSPLVKGRDLRPALDVEWGHPSAQVGRWVTDVAAIVHAKLGVKPVIYGNGWFLQACAFPSAPGSLWLAAYGRDDGKEYPVGRLPAPWQVLAAHQFTDQAHVVGIVGHCDLSHVFVPNAIEVPK